MTRTSSTRKRYGWEGGGRGGRVGVAGGGSGGSRLSDLRGRLVFMIREQLEADEKKVLSPQAQFSAGSAGRPRAEAADPMRPCFQHDRDKILHSKAFRRLAGKTQVFL